MEADPADLAPKRRLRLEKPGYLPAFRTVTLTGGDELGVSLDLSAELEMDEAEAPTLAALALV